MNIIQKVKLLMKAEQLYNQLKKIDMQAIKNALIKNWKTTVGGIAVVIVGVLVKDHALTVSTGGLITSILGGLGLIAAKDGND